MSSSSVVQALFLICGSRWFCHRSRHCFAVRRTMCLEIRVQFIVPYFFTSSAICQSKGIGKCCIRHILIRLLLAFFFWHLFIFIFGPVGFQNSGIEVHIPTLHTLQFGPPLSVTQTYLNLTESTLKPLYNQFSITPSQYLQVKNWQWFSNQTFQSC